MMTGSASSQTGRSASGSGTSSGRGGIAGAATSKAGSALTGSGTSSGGGGIVGAATSKAASAATGSSGAMETAMPGLLGAAGLAGVAVAAFL